MTNNIGIYSGYYSYDEEYLRINGIKAYRLTLFDTIFNYPIAEEISYNLESTTIKAFLKEVTNNIPVECVITDHVPKYREILDELKINHQLCLFHFLKMVTELREKELKKNKDDEVETELIMKECNELKEIYRAHTYKEAVTRYIYFLKNLNNDRTYLTNFVKKHVVRNFKHMIPRFFDFLIEKTTNKSENYYRQTDSDRIKKKYKTHSGILNYLHLKMKHTTEQALKKIT